MVEQRTAPRTDPIQLEIFRQRFKAIAEEMASVILRTGFTVFVKETSDFGACLLTPNGEVLAAPLETSVSYLVGLPAQTAINALSDYAPGDIGISNDPELTKGMATHLPDIWLWKPIFAEGEIVAFGICCIHSSDVGGRVPGSIAPSNYEIFQEGLRIPPTKLFKRGVLNQPLLKIILANCRIPDQNWGDIKALLAGLSVAERRVHEVVARYGKAPAVRGISDLLDLAESRARALIRRIPEGTYTFADYMEGDVAGGRPIRINLTLTARDGAVYLDFTGTDLQVRAALNLPSWNQHGHYMFACSLLNYFRSLEPDIPYNSGLVRPIYVNIPRGTLLNPEPHVAVGVRAATSFRVLDNLTGCLTQALPGAIPAASSGAVAIVLIATLDEQTGERRVSVAQPLIGGSGGRPTQEAIDGTSFTGGFLRNIPNETLEADMPVLVEQYGYREGSAAPGRRRGGVGTSFRLRSLATEMVMTARGMERFTFRPWGLYGGRAGELGVATLNPGTPAERNLGKIDVLHLVLGDVVEFHSASGGGYGDPFEREPWRVLDDVEAGLVDADSVERDYGVVLADGAVDEAATRERRAGRAGSSTGPVFDLGPERLAYEARWPDALQTALVERLLSYPSALRWFLRDKVGAAIDARLDAGEPPDVALLNAALAAVMRRLEADVLGGEGAATPAQETVV